MADFEKDLVVLVADLDMETTIRGLLDHRIRSFDINVPPTYDIFRHLQRDPGCLNDSPNFLRNFSRKYERALVLFDHEGSGAENKSIEIIQTNLENQLAANGWNANRVRVIVIDPELEIWVWSGSTKTLDCLGWGEHTTTEFWQAISNFQKHTKLTDKPHKPARPKEAMEWALRQKKKARSAAIFAQLAKEISFKRCTDTSFQRLSDTLKSWYG